MSHLANIFDQESAIETLLWMKQEARIPHALIFDGPPGVGKSLTAISFAKQVLQANAEMSQRIDGGNHPDVVMIEPRDEGQGNIQVETLRQDILPRAAHAPFEASSSFFIFLQAEKTFSFSHPASANCMLKTLEEPKKNVHFILVTDQYESIIPTIRSRASRIRFHPLGKEALLKILEQKEIDPSTKSFALDCAEGSAKAMFRWLALLEDEKTMELIQEFQTKLMDQHTLGLLLLAERLSKDEQGEDVLRFLLSMFRASLHQRLISENNSANTSNTSTSSSTKNEQPIQQWIDSLSQLPSKRLTQGVSKLISLIDVLSTNQNKQLAFEQTFQELASE